MTIQRLRAIPAAAGVAGAGWDQPPSLDGVAATVAGYEGTVLATISRYVQPAPGDRRTGRLTVVAAAGDIDRDTAPLLHTALIQALDTQDRVCCDLSGVEFFGASGINTLVLAHRHATELGRTFFVRGVHGVADITLSIAGLNHVLAPPD